MIKEQEHEYDYVVHLPPSDINTNENVPPTSPTYLDIIPSSDVSNDGYELSSARLMEGNSSSDGYLLPAEMRPNQVYTDAVSSDMEHYTTLATNAETR